MTSQTTTTETDAGIQRDVLEELRWDARVKPNGVEVAARDRVVTLTGSVDSYAKKWAAERDAHRVRGVRAVVNDIKVRLPRADERTDSDIAAMATHALEWDTLVPEDGVEVTVSQGWVTLAGAVEWEFQRRAAERTVRRLSGVRGVTDLLAVRPRIRPEAEELGSKIREALVRCAETDADRIGVQVDDGTVVLSGTVRSWMQRQEAERVVWSAPGVTTVDNRVTVVV